MVSGTCGTALEALYLAVGMAQQGEAVPRTRPFPKDGSEAGTSGGSTRNGTHSPAMC